MIRIFHNPRCSTSRAVLAMIRESGVEPEVVDCLQTGWTSQRLQALARATGQGLRGLLRAKEPLARELNLADADDDALLRAMLAHPVLVERPIVEAPRGTVLCRPAERVREVL